MAHKFTRAQQSAGGLKRLKTMTAAERSERARLAAAARWAEPKPFKKRKAAK